MKNFLTWFHLKGRCKDLLLYIAVVLCLLMVNILFHDDIYHSVVLSSIWKSPWNAWTHYYFPKFAPCLLLGTLVFVCKRKWWLLLLFALVDTWVIANLFYFRANGILLTWEAIMMASNLQGFTSSLLTYASLGMLKYILITVLMIPIIWLYEYSSNEHKRQPYFAAFSIMAGLFCLSMSNYMDWDYLTHVEGEEFKDRHQTNSWEAMYGKNCYKLWIPYVNAWMSGKYQLRFNVEGYVRNASIIQYFFDMPVRALAMAVGPDVCEEGGVPEEIGVRVVNTQCSYMPNRDLYIILVESLESWPISDYGILRDVMPNLYQFSKNEHVLYCNKVRTEVRHGVSGDGQMIVNTGLLPIANGAACILYGDRVYPNFAHLYPYSAIINPCPKEWGQDKVTYSYGYKQLIEPRKNGDWADKEVIDELSKIARSDRDAVGCYMAITVSTHTPFDRVRYQTMTLPGDMPKMMAGYMNCLHYTDECIGSFLSLLETNERLRNSTIVITGDHTVWKSATLSELKPYSTQYELNIPMEESYTPFIVYSPSISENMTINELTYQMDIFPTIMGVIGCEDYYWKGFGENLYQQDTLCQRVDEAVAFDVSDRMIRSNFFKNPHR